MRKYLFKTVALMTVAIMLFSNLVVFADGKKGKNDKEFNFRGNMEYVQVGEITQIKSNVITLGEKSDKSMFKLSDKTTILDENDKKIKSSELKVGLNVEITYNKLSKDKKDKVNTAISVKVIKNYVEIKNAYIEDIYDYSKTEKAIAITYNTVDSKNRIVENNMNLIINANTKIYNQLGEAIKVSNLKQGMLIDVEHSTLQGSKLLQAYALKISIVKTEEDNKTTEAKILKTYTSNKKSYILVGEANNAAKQILFVLDEKAVIKNQYNKKIEFKDLLVGQKISVVHSNAMTRSLPPQSVAFSVQVVDDLATVIKENAIINDITYISKSEYFVRISYETKDSNNKIIKNEMDLVVDNNTFIIDQFNDDITVLDLNKGMVIRVEHSNKMTRSTIPQSYAYKISIVKDYADTNITEAKLLEKYILDGELYVLVGDANSVYKQTLFVLSENVKIKNQYGKTIGFKDLLVDQKIRVEHSKTMSKSIPPQCLAYSIEIIDDYNIEYIGDAVIEEINTKNKNITISYEVVVGNRIYEYFLILVVDNDTIILDKKGKAISFSSLKVGMIIDVEHELLAVLSSPPKSYAHKINVIYDSVNEPIDDEDCELYRLLIKLFVETDSKEWLNCILNHNHGWNNLNGFNMEDYFEDYFEDMFESSMDEDDIEDLLESIFKGYRWYD